MDAIEDLRARIAALETKLEAAEEVLTAIREGEVDAVVVRGPKGEQVFTLEGADHPYRVLVEQMQEGTLTLDQEGLILYSNQRFADLVEEKIERVVGSRVSSYLAPESQLTFAALLEATPQSYGREELCLQTSRGSGVPALVSLNHLEFAEKHFVSAVITDLTEQRRNEAIVREEQLSRLMLEQAAEAIVVIDGQGKILRASDAAHKLAGRNVLFQPFDAMFRLDGTEGAGGRLDAEFLLAAAWRGSVLRGMEVVLELPGTSAALLLSAGALWGGDGELAGCVVTLMDITRRKADEESLARQARELERSNNDLRQFAYSASHDLREPLRVVSLYSQLIQEKLREEGATGGVPEARSLLGQVIIASQRMDTQLQDLLSYVQACEGPQEPATFASSHLVLNKALESLKATITEQNARVEWSSLPRLRMQEIHLEQLFQNLISNALKYRRDETPVIRVSAVRDGSFWRISVSDNGIGIAQRYQRQIFGLFKRLHAKAEYGGSGIGLAICQRIVERYGGNIWVESDPGRGSTFYFTAPGVETETGWEANSAS